MPSTAATPRLTGTQISVTIAPKRALPVESAWTETTSQNTTNSGANTSLNTTVIPAQTPDAKPSQGSALSEDGKRLANHAERNTGSAIRISSWVSRNDSALT